MDNLKRAAQGTLSEREVLDVASRLSLDRWEDDGGQEAPTNAALTISHHQAPSGQTIQPMRVIRTQAMDHNKRETHSAEQAYRERGE